MYCSSFSSLPLMASSLEEDLDFFLEDMSLLCEHLHYVLKLDHHQPAHHLWLLERTDREVDHLLGPVRLDPQALNGYLRLLGHRFTDGDSQLRPQALARHGIDVQIRFPDRRFQVFPSPPGKVKDVSLVIDEHHRRCDGLEDELLGDLGDAGIGNFWCRYSALHADFIRQRRRGEFDQSFAGDECLPALEDLPFVVQWREEIGEASYGLGRAEEEKAFRIQGVMEEWQELLLRLGVQINEKVSAAEQVQLGERRVGENVLLAKTIISLISFLDAIADRPLL